MRNISEIKVDNEPITSAVQMAEVFNDYFATIGSNLASEIQPSPSLTNGRGSSVVGTSRGSWVVGMGVGNITN